MTADYLARRMFLRQSEQYDAEPALVELAWADPQIAGFWLAEAQAVLDDIKALDEETECS